MNRDCARLVVQSTPRADKIERVLLRDDLLKEGVLGLDACFVGKVQRRTLCTGSCGGYRRFRIPGAKLLALGKGQKVSPNKLVCRQIPL